MRPGSFSRRLFLSNVGLFLGLAALAGLVSYHFLQQEYARRQRGGQEQVAAIYRDQIAHRWPDPGAHRDQIDAWCKQQRGGPLGQMRLTVIHPSGEVLGDSSTVPAEEMDDHRTEDRPEVLAAIDGRTGWDVRVSETLQREFSYLAVPVQRDGRVRAVVRLAVPARSLAESEGFIWRTLLLAGGAAGALAVLLGLLLSWMWYRPLRQISLSARALAGGKLRRPVRMSGSDELAQLAESLETMRQSLREQIDRIRSQQKSLQTVVASLQEGLVATDSQDRVVLINQAASRVLEVTEDQAVGAPVQTVAHVMEMVDLYDQVRASGAPASRRVSVGVIDPRHHYDVTVTPIAGEENLGMLLVIRDVSEIVQTAAMRSEFVTNASHELRTPLTTLRATVDSLGDLESGDRDGLARMIAIMDRHLNRLEELTRDLLTLNVITSERFALMPEPVDLDELIGKLSETFSADAAAKGARLTCRLDPPEATVITDMKLLHLIVQNLLDNAVKFTGEGGTVTCAMAVDGEQLRIEVADTGCGIARKDQPRVFERFYQADPARSGGVKRGTGLGLSLVKHAVEGLGGSVMLASTVGEGTTVVVTVPVEPLETPDVNGAEA